MDLETKINPSDQPLNDNILLPQVKDNMLKESLKFDVDPFQIQTSIPLWLTKESPQKLIDASHARTIL